MNKVILIGNLTKAPEAGKTNNGNTYAKFTIAVNRSHNREEVDYINIVTWNGTAENCAKYLSKGKKVAVVGELQIRSYETTDGGKRYSTEVIAQEVQFLSAARTDDNQASDGMIPVDEDLPF